jgi:hypothetical protein
MVCRVWRGELQCVGRVVGGDLHLGARELGGGDFLDQAINVLAFGPRRR